MRVLHLTPHPQARNGISEYATSFSQAMAEHAGVQLEPVFFHEAAHSRREIGAHLSAIDLDEFHVVHAEIGVGTNSVLYAMEHVVRRRRDGLLVTLHDPPRFVFSPTVDLFGYRVDGLANKVVRKLIADPLYNATRLRAFARRVARYVVLNRGAVDATRARFPGVDVEYVPLLASGKQRPAAVGPATNLLFYGFLARAKGIDLAIQAVHLLRGRGLDVRLHVVGGTLDEAFREALRRSADQLALTDHVEWHGFVDDAHLDAVLADGGIVVMPYRETDTFGGSAAAVRVMEQGLPLVLSDIRRFAAEFGSAMDVVTFREGDATDLAAKLQLVITDPEHRARLAAASARRIAEVHDRKAVADAFRAVYERSARRLY